MGGLHKGEQLLPSTSSSATPSRLRGRRSPDIGVNFPRRPLQVRIGIIIFSSGVVGLVPQPHFLQRGVRRNRRPPPHRGGQRFGGGLSTTRRPARWHRSDGWASESISKPRWDPTILHQLSNLLGCKPGKGFAERHRADVFLFFREILLLLTWKEEAGRRADFHRASLWDRRQSRGGWNRNMSRLLHVAGIHLPLRIESRGSRNRNRLVKTDRTSI